MSSRTTAHRVNTAAAWVSEKLTKSGALGHEAELVDPVHEMITNDQRRAFLDAIRAGATIKDAADTAGIHRPRVYTLRDRDPEFARQLSEAREPHPATTGQLDDRELVSYEHDLDRGQIGELVRALHKCGNLARACRSSGIDLFPRRISPADIPRDARDHMRAALKIIAEARAPKPPSAEQEELAAWLNGSPWPLDMDVVKLRQLSPRAAADYERVLMVRAAERAANELGDAGE